MTISSDENTYDIGDKVRLKVTIEVGSPQVDPDDLTFRIKRPNNEVKVYSWAAGSPTSEEIKQSATGIFYVDYVIAQEGRHYYRWEATGDPAHGAEERSFKTRDSEFY